MKKGVFVVISGPSGVGKDTIVNRIINDGLGIYSVSMTTRNMREGEVNGKDYFFLSKEEFLDNIKKDNLFEYAIYNNNYYGTPKNFVFNNINNGKNVIAIIDVQGAMKIENKYSDALSIFIMPPNFEELERRLINRGTDSMDNIKKRLEIAKKEISYSNKYDYIIINDNMEKTIDEIENIIKSYSQSRL